MPRSTIASRRATIFDKSLELRNFSGAAISATTAETGVAFNATKINFYKAVAHTTGYTGYVAGTAEWQAIIEVATSIGGTYRQVGIATIPATAGDIQIPLEGSYIEDILAEATHVRVRAVKVGTPGNLTYGTYLSC